MSIAEHLQEILNAKAAIASSIANKGVIVPEGAKLADFSALIDSIQQGGGPTGPIIFADPNVKAICVANWGSGGEITYEQASMVTDLGTIFNGNTQITSFNELQYFTGLTILGNTTFMGCSNLTSIIIPNSITVIEDGIIEGYGCFGGCISLTSVSLPNSLTSIGVMAFALCSNLTSISIPNSIISLGDACFALCESLTSIVIPDSVTTIGDDAFTQCIGLSTIIISNSLISIGVNAFSGCVGLTSLIIPNSVTSIGRSAFSSCANLTTINCLNPIPPTLGSVIFTNCPNLTNIYVPTESVNIYKTAPGWSAYANFITAII